MTVWEPKQNIAADLEHRVLKSGIDTDSKIATNVPYNTYPLSPAAPLQFNYLPAY